MLIIGVSSSDGGDWDAVDDCGVDGLVRGKSIGVGDHLGHVWRRWAGGVGVDVGVGDVWAVRA